MNKLKIVFISYEFYPPYYSGKLLMSHFRFQNFNPETTEVIVLTKNVKGLPEGNNSLIYHFYKAHNFGEGKVGKRLSAVYYWIWAQIVVRRIEGISAIHFDEPAVIPFPFLKGWGSKMGWKAFESIANWANKKNIPTFYEYATSDIGKDFDPEPEKQEFLNKVDKIVSVSYRLNDAVAEELPEKALVAPYGIDVDLFVPITEKEKLLIRESFGTSGRNIVFSFVGLMVYRKGIDLICNAFNRLCEERDDINLWMIGPQNEKESRHVHDDEVAGYKASLGKNFEKVAFFGNINDRNKLARLMAASDIFLFPTRREGFGLAPVEAMSCGVPPIIARIEGITDLANIDGETGLYIQPGDEDELFDAMKVLAKDRVKRKTMGIAARERVVNDFSINSHAKTWLDIYKGTRGS